MSIIISLPLFFFFFNDTATTEIYTLSLHDALPIFARHAAEHVVIQARDQGRELGAARCVEPRLRGVFRRGLRRVELHHSLAVEVQHGGEETMRQRFSESRSEEHTSELQSRLHLVCRLLL